MKSLSSGGVIALIAPPSISGGAAITPLFDLSIDFPIATGNFRSVLVSLNAVFTDGTNVVAFYSIAQITVVVDGAGLFNARASLVPATSNIAESSTNSVVTSLSLTVNGLANQNRGISPVAGVNIGLRYSFASGQNWAQQPTGQLTYRVIEDVMSRQQS